MACVMCQPPARSFITDPDRFCIRVLPGSSLDEDFDADRRSSLLADAAPARRGAVNGAAVPSTVMSPRRLGFRWDVDPRDNPPIAWPRCSSLNDSTQAVRPAWLAGVGRRDINPDSADERALARNFSTCLLALPPRRVNLLLFSRLYAMGTPEQDFGGITDELYQLAQSYNVGEMSGASWRAAAVRDSVAVELNLTTEAARSSAALDRDLSGQLLLRAETTYVVALTGYHPRLLVSIAAGSVIGYLLMVVAGFAAPIIRARVERRRRDSAETEAAGGEDSGGEWEKEAVVQDDERSTQRRAHSCATPAAELSAQAWATGTNER
ncbi:hypothetical protein I4F81_006344 [Pyropia yezoensis]|uniref:Uncharacterized protein n=1 Tax=Pyropia yezoensis TaxID=2788 RepID=A0ACC3C0R3_PYRYE|nr:hypothetical protein I4F81_006344 [Neopyropia yezoensis]